MMYDAENATREEAPTDSVYSTNASLPQTANVSSTTVCDMHVPAVDISVSTTSEMSPSAVDVLASTPPLDTSISTPSLQLADNASPSQTQVSSLTTATAPDVTTEGLQNISES